MFLNFNKKHKKTFFYIYASYVSLVVDRPSTYVLRVWTTISK